MRKYDLSMECEDWRHGDVGNKTAAHVGTEEDLMDLGFGSFVDQIEKRFGKLVTNIVLLFLILGIVAWGLETAISTYFSGVLEFEKGGAIAVVGLIRLVSFHAILIFFTCIVIYAFFFTIKKRAVDSIERKGKEEVGKLERIISEKLESFRSSIDSEGD